MDVRQKRKLIYKIKINKRLHNKICVKGVEFIKFHFKKLRKKIL